MWPEKQSDALKKLMEDIGKKAEKDPRSKDYPGRDCWRNYSRQKDLFMMGDYHEDPIVDVKKVATEIMDEADRNNRPSFLRQEIDALRTRVYILEAEHVIHIKSHQLRIDTMAELINQLRDELRETQEQLKDLMEALDD